MKKIKFIGNYRGFLNDLFTLESNKITFIYDTKSEFEIANKKKEFLIRLFNSKYLDFMGLFTTNYDNSDYVDLLSYNRFIKSSGDKNYSIILENPTALVNYSSTKMYSYFAKKKLKRLFEDPNLKKIICMSKSCEKSFYKYYGDMAGDKLIQIYPLIKENNSLKEDMFKPKPKNSDLNVLYISSDFKLKGGDDILEVFKNLKESYPNIKLTIITKVSKLDFENKEDINKLKNITLLDFSLNREELSHIYESSNILLNPSRMDSFSLVTLEAIKSGCAIISSDIYAISEMVHENKNGFLCRPQFEYWNLDGTINNYIKKNPKKTYASNYIDQNMIGFIFQSLVTLNNNREMLMNFQRYSYNLSRNSDFGEKSIKKNWENIYNDREGNK